IDDSGCGGGGPDGSTLDERAIVREVGVGDRERPAELKDRATAQDGVVVLEPDVVHLEVTGRGDGGTSHYRPSVLHGEVAEDECAAGCDLEHAVGAWRPIDDGGVSAVALDDEVGGDGDAGRRV